MKKVTSIIIALFVLVSAVSVSSCKHEDPNAVPVLLERKGDLGPVAETDNVKQIYLKSVAALKENPDDIKDELTLATVFISEGRITGNGGYYSNAAMKMLNMALSNPNIDKDKKFEALSLKSAVLLNMHQFKEALAAAQQGVDLNNYNSGIFGALVDANVELGNYAEAIKDCDKMLSLRPDLRSYSRASYLRQIHGDNKGAIVAMKMAVDAGLTGAESTEWARVNLGDLYLNVGNADSARIEYRTALVYRPNYAFADMGMARAARAEKKYDEAIEYTRTAIKIMSEAAFVSYLGDLYELKGDTKKAGEIREDVVRLLQEGESNQPKDALIKHNVSREMSMAFMNVGDLNRAMEYARVDLDMRPENIDANELVEWLYYMNGNYKDAKVHAEKTLKTNIKNVNTLYKAGVIYKAAGDAATGDSLLAQSAAVSPFVDQRLITQTKK